MTASRKSKKSVSKGVQGLWAGRFQGGMATSMEKLSISLPVDRKLFREDLEGSMAHVHGLFAAKVLSSRERDRLLAGLKGILRDLEAGAELFSPSDEDIHMAVERVLTERIGALGKKLHAGRSRNDQVATDFRLYALRRAQGLIGQVEGLQRVLLRRSEEYRKDLMPGYTHMQQAQPIYEAHYLQSFFFAQERDKTRLRHAAATAGEMP
jgi:argininosuccinate lyase